MKHTQRNILFIVLVVFVLVIIPFISLPSNKNQVASVVSTKIENIKQITWDDLNKKELSQVYIPSPVIFPAVKQKGVSTEIEQTVKNNITLAYNTFISSQKSVPVGDPVAIKPVDEIKLASKLFLIDGQTPVGAGTVFAPVLRSVNGTSWAQATTNDPFLSRNEFPAVYFNNKIFFASGWNGVTTDDCAADVWYSTNGKGWLPATQHAPWAFQGLSSGGRWGHTLTVFNDGSGTAMYLIGGAYCTHNQSPNSIASDVWKSTDGNHWVQVTAGNSILGARLGHTTVVFNNRLYVIGGFRSSGATPGFQNDVVWTDDGVHWNNATTNALFSPRADHSSFVYGGKLWIAGGYYFNANGIQMYIDPVVITNPLATMFGDIWSSSDGVTWTREVWNAPWTARRGQSIEKDGTTLYLLGGSKGQGPAGYLSEVWKSQNATNWVRVGSIQNSTTGTVLPVANAGSVITPASFGIGVPGSPPEVSIVVPANIPVGSIPLNPLLLNNTTFGFRSTVNPKGSQTTLQFEYANLSLGGQFSQFFGNNNFTTLLPVTTQSVYQINQSGLALDTNYAYRAIATNSIGMTRSSFNSVRTGGCINTLTPKVQFTSPPGGDTYAMGQQLSVNWQSCNLPQTSSIDFYVFDTASGNAVSSVSTTNSGTQVVTLPTVPGVYMFVITDHGSTTGYGSTGQFIVQ